MLRTICILLVLMVFVTSLFSEDRFVMLEDFESSGTLFQSIDDYDGDQGSWQISPNGQEGQCLRLFGNTGKRLAINPQLITERSVIQFSVKLDDSAGLVAVGVKDSINSLRYSLYGSQEQDIEEFVTCYQGAKEAEQWIEFKLPVADDWQAWYDYIPVINGLEFITVSSDSVFFDNIIDVTEDINQEPECSFSYRLMGYNSDGSQLRNVTYQFQAEVTDPEGDIISDFRWYFGDGTIETATFSRINHTFEVVDDHPYSVLLEVTDNQGAIGRHVEQVAVDVGDSSLPVTLNFVGDVMFARRMNSSNVPNIFTEVDSVFGQGADISVANLETPLSDMGTRHPTKSVAFRSDPSTVVALENGGIDLVSLANNHSWDYMNPALQQTMDVLEASNILHCGAGMNSIDAYKPAYIHKKGLIFAFLGSSDRTGQYNNAIPYLNAGYDKAGFGYMTPYYISEQIESVEGIADLNVVMMHAGSEYSTSPGSDYDKTLETEEDEDFNPRIDIPHMWDREIRHHAIDSGTDLVVVHHPHKVQGVEVYNGKVVAHSLGNFVFDLNYPECFPSMILNTEADRDGFKNFTITPIYLDEYKPKVIFGELGTHLLRYIAMKSRELDTIVHVNNERNRGEVIIDSLDYNFHEFNHQQNVPVSSIDDYFVSKPIRFEGVPLSMNSITGGTEHIWRIGNEAFPMGNMEFEGVSYWNNFPNETNEVHSGSTSNSLAHPWEETETDELMPIRPGDKTLVGYIKTDNCTDAHIEVDFYSSHTGLYPNSTYSSNSVSGTTDWTEVSVEIPQSNAHEYFGIRLVREGTDTESIAYFDDIHLILWKDWVEEQGYTMMYPNDYYWLRLSSSTAQDNMLSLSYTTCDITYHDPVNNNNQVVKPITDLCNYPNPFNPETTIEFKIKNRVEKAELSVYNVKGQKVITLHKGDLAKGKHRFRWYGEDRHGKSCATGIYFYRLKAGNNESTAKMILMK